MENAQNSKGDLSVATPRTMAANELDKAAQKLSENADKAGAKVGKAKQAVGKLPLSPIQDVGQAFWKKVQDDFGLNLFTKKDGTIIAKEVEGRNIQVSPSDKKRILNVAQQLSDLGTKPSTDTKICKVSIVGIGMRSHAGVANTMFSALADKAINIQVISTSEIKVSVLIAAEYTELAVRALHTAYGLDAN